MPPKEGGREGHVPSLLPARTLHKFQKAARFVCFILFCVLVSGFVHMSAGAPGGQSRVSNSPKAGVTCASEPSHVGAGNQPQILHEEQRVPLTTAPGRLQTWICLTVETRVSLVLQPRLALKSRQPFCTSPPKAEVTESHHHTQQHPYLESGNMKLKATLN